MTVNISVQARNEAGDAIVDLIDQGSTSLNGRIEIRSGIKPSLPLDGASGTLLATLNFTSPAFGDFNEGVSLANPITSDLNIDNTGVASWFRFYDRDGGAVMDGNITRTGGDGDITFDNINFVKGGIVAISSLTAAMPA